MSSTNYYNQGQWKSDLSDGKHIYNVVLSNHGSPTNRYAWAIGYVFF